MAVSSLDKSLLTHELQLGEKLNECIHGERRSDFSLMLAMLTDDVLSHSQFSLPLAESIAKSQSEEALRNSFELPEKAPLALDDNHEIDAFNQAELIHQDRLIELHLQDALKPKPLAFRDDSSHVNTQVLTNTSLYCQRKYHQKLEEKKDRLKFNATEWLKAVQTTIVKAPLISVPA